MLLYERKYQENENQLWDLVPDDASNTDSAIANSLNESGDEEEYQFSSASYAL